MIKFFSPGGSKVVNSNAVPEDFLHIPFFSVFE